MVIIIGNQKGGPGKSTLALLLANFLTMEKQCGATVIDMDYQQSIAQKFQRAKVLENPEPYQVVAARLDEYAGFEDLLNGKPEHLVIIDLPGKLDDDGLLPVFLSAGLVICPFAYDEFSFESTILFAVVLRKLNPQIAIIFIPNRVKANVRYETMQSVNEQLAKLGRLTPAVPDRIDFQRVNTFMTPASVIPVISPVFEQVYEKIQTILHPEPTS